MAVADAQHYLILREPDPKLPQPEEDPDRQPRQKQGGIRQVREVLGITDERSGTMEGIANGETLGYRGRRQPGYERADDRELPRYMPPEANAQAGPGPRSMNSRSVASQAKSNIANGRSPYHVTGITSNRNRRVDPEIRCRQQQEQGLHRKRSPDYGGIAHQHFGPVAEGKMYAGNSLQRADRDASRQPLRSAGPLRESQLRYVPEERYDSYSDQYDDAPRPVKTTRDRNHHPIDPVVDAEPGSPKKVPKDAFGGHAKKLSSDADGRPRNSDVRKSTSPTKGQVASTSRRTSIHSISSDEERKQSSPEALEPIEPPKTRAKSKKVQGTNPGALPIGPTPGEARQRATDEKQIIGAAKGKARAKDDADFIIPSTGVGQKLGPIKSSNLPRRYAVDVSESWLNVEPLTRLLASGITWDANSGDLSFIAKGREIFRIPPKAISSDSDFCDSTNFPIMWMQINRTGCESFIDQLKNCYGVDIQDFSFRVLFRLKSDVLSGQLVASLAAWLKAKARVKVHTMDEPAAIALITGITAQSGRDRRQRTAVQDQMVEAAEKRHQNQRQAPRNSRNSKRKDIETLSDESVENKENKKATTKRKPKPEGREPGQSELPFTAKEGKPKSKDRPFIDMASGEEGHPAKSRTSARTAAKAPAQYLDPSDEEVELGKKPEQAVIEPPVTTLAKPDNPSGVLFPYPLTGRANINITEMDKWRVEAGDFLNDTLIEFGLKHIISEVKEGAKSDIDIDDDVYLFNSFFYQKLSVPNKPFTGNEVWPAYDSVKKWTKGKEIFRKKYLIIPINENAHWYLAVIVNPAGVLRAPEPEVDEYAVGSVTRAAGNLSLAPDQDAQDADQASDEIQAEEVRSLMTTPGGGEYKDLQTEYEAELNDRDPEDGLDILGTPTTDKPIVNAEISSSPYIAADTSFDVLDSIPRDMPSRPAPAAATVTSRTTRRAGHDSSCIDLSVSPEPEPEGKPINSRTLKMYTRQNSGQKDMPDEARGMIEAREEGEQEGLRTSTSSMGKGKTKENFNILGSDDTWIITFDSLGGSHKAVDRILGKWLQFEAVDKQGKSRDMLSKSRYREARVPNQPNYSDCGLYLIHYVQQLLNRPEEIISFIGIAVPAGGHQTADRSAYNGQMNDIWRESETKQLRQLWTSIIDSLAIKYTRIRQERGQSEPDNQADDDDDDLVIAASQDPWADQARQEQGFRDEGGGEGGGGLDSEGNVKGKAVDIPQESGDTAAINSFALPPELPGDIQMMDTEAAVSPLDPGNDSHADDAFGISTSSSSQPRVLLPSSTGGSVVEANGTRPSVPPGELDAEDEASTFNRDPPGAMDDPEADRDLLDEPQPNFVPETQTGQSEVTPPNFQTSTSQDASDTGVYAAAERRHIDAGALSSVDEDCQVVSSQQARKFMAQDSIEEDQLDDSDEEQEQPEGDGVDENQNPYREQAAAHIGNVNQTADSAPPTAGRKRKVSATQAQSDGDSSSDIEDVTESRRQVNGALPSNRSMASATVYDRPTEDKGQMRNAHNLSRENERKAQSAPADRTHYHWDPARAAVGSNAPHLLSQDDREDLQRRLGNQPSFSTTISLPKPLRHSPRGVAQYLHYFDGHVSSGPSGSKTPYDEPSLPVNPTSENLIPEPAVDPALRDVQAEPSLDTLLDGSNAETSSKGHYFGSESSSPRSRSPPLVGFPKRPLFGSDTHDTSSSSHQPAKIGSPLKSDNNDDESTATISRKGKMRAVELPITVMSDQVELDEGSPLTELPLTTGSTDIQPLRSSSSAPEWIEQRSPSRNHDAARSTSPLKVYRRSKPETRTRQHSLSSDPSSDEDINPEKKFKEPRPIDHKRDRKVQVSSIGDVQERTNGPDTHVRPLLGFPSASDIEPTPGSKSGRSRQRLRDSPHPDNPRAQRSSMRQAISRASPSKGSEITVSSGKMMISSRKTDADEDQFSSTVIKERKRLKRHTGLGSGSVRTEDGTPTSKRQKTNDGPVVGAGDPQGDVQHEEHQKRDPTKSASTPTTRKSHHSDKKHGPKSSQHRQTTMDSWATGQNGGAGSSSAPAGRSTVERTAKSNAKVLLQVQGRNGSDGTLDSPIDIDDDDGS